MSWRKRKEERAEELQRKRERLKELEEEKWSCSGLRMHRVQKTMAEREEIARLKREIERQESLGKRIRKGLLLAGAAAALLCSGFLLIRHLPSDTEVVIIDEEDADIAPVPALEAAIETDYTHADSDPVTILGQDEGATITLTADREGITEDDLVLAYEESLLAITWKSREWEEGKTVLTCYVTGKREGVTSLQIALKGESESCTFVIQKLDDDNGRLCYVTPTGKKYHLKEGCAGQNAVPTTLYDAAASGIMPCRTCAR